MSDQPGTSNSPGTDENSAHVDQGSFRRMPTYSGWTRFPVAYLPVTLDAEVIGYLWGSKGGSAAGFFPRIASGADRFKCSDYWDARLTEAYALGLTPEGGIRHFIGTQPDEQCGGIASDAVESEASSMQELALLVNPGAPLGDGPQVQDGTYSDGTPTDRSKGWGPLHSTPLPPSYPTETSSPIVFFPISRRDTVLGYLWAATTGDAGGYLPRAATGEDGALAGALWTKRLRDANRAGLSSLEALQRCRTAAPYVYEEFGLIGAEATERTAASLAELQDLAERQ